MENIQEVNMCIVRKKQAPVTVTTLDLIKMANFVLSAVYYNLRLSSWRRER